MDVVGKRITIAGKLVGRYAKARRDLAARIEHMGGEVCESFEINADIVVVASKAKGFEKRIAKMDAVTITEAQLEAIVAAAYVSPPSPPEKATVWTFMRAIDGLERLDPLERRRVLFDAICDHAARGYRFAFDTAPVSIPPVRREAQSVLAWCGFECALYIVTEDQWTKSSLLEDICQLHGARVAYAGGLPMRIYGAAMRVLTAMGFGAETVWSKMKGDIDDDWQEAGLASVADLDGVGTPLVDHALKSPTELDFPIERLYVVHDDIAW